MQPRSWFVPMSTAVALALGAGCATEQKPTPPVESAQQESQRALKSASEAQAKANDEQQRAVASQRAADEARQRSLQAQAKANEDAQRARQAQVEAQRLTALEQQRASQAQQAAIAAQQPSQPGTYSVTIRHTDGTLKSAGPNEISLSTASNPDLRLKIGPNTVLSLNGQAVSPLALPYGADVHASFVVPQGQTEATALQIQAYH